MENPIKMDDLGVPPLVSGFINSTSHIPLITAVKTHLGVPEKINTPNLMVYHHFPYKTCYPLVI